MSSIAELLGQAESAVRAAEDLAALDAVRVQFLGKKGVFTAQLREIGKLPPAEIPAAGKAINDAKSALDAAIDARRDALEARRLAEQLAAEALDVTLPGRGTAPGQLHPVTRTLRRMVRDPRPRRLRRAHGPRGRRRLPQLHGAEHPGRTIRRVRCTTRSTCAPACCCERIRRPCRSARSRRTARRSGSSRRAASTGATPISRIRRCSRRSKGSSSIAT